MSLFGIAEVLDLVLYDEFGHKLLELDYLNDAKILRGKDKCFLLLSHEITDFDLIELMNDNKFKSDFEKELGDIEIGFGNCVNTSDYKLIGNFKIRNTDGEDKEVKLIFNKVKFDELDTDYLKSIFKFSAEEVSKFDTVFRVYLDENNKYFTMKSTL